MYTYYFNEETCTLYKYSGGAFAEEYIVNDAVYTKFAEILGDDEEPSVVYGKWVGIADSILNAQMI